MIRPEDWHPADGMALEPNALHAAQELTANVVVAAGPGAGKTELLAQRADFLLRTGHCRYPQRILAISFKVDAARNIRERVRKRCGDQLSARFDSFTFHAFAKRIVDNYRVVLTGRDALDPDYTLDARDRIERTQITFDDLAPLAITILQNSPAARNAIRQTYSHVLLDEFQDATRSQYALVKEAFLGKGAVLTAVGDVKQRIMSFAGALDGIMQIFASDFAATPLPLYQNYRSEPVLRRMQNRMVQVMDPLAAVPVAELTGNEGSIEVLPFTASVDEAAEIADRIQAWLAQGVPPYEIAILVRQLPHLLCEPLINELKARAIASRNEQLRQDLTAEPIAALVLNLIRVLADSRRSSAYGQLMRLIARTGVPEETALRSTRAVTRFLAAKRERLREGRGARSDSDEWKKAVFEFLELVTRPVLYALSPEYRQGTRLDMVIEQTVTAFTEELDKDGDPVSALLRLSEEDAVRILTIHKCKGLEFEKVVVLAVEPEVFWGRREDMLAEFFVAISRAKNELILTWARYRPRPNDARGRWDEARGPQNEFLGFAYE